MWEIYTFEALSDSLHPTTEAEQRLAWQMRHYCMENNIPLLPKIIRAVDWTNLGMVSSIYWLLDRWPAMKPTEALELLGSHYEDRRVRLVCTTSSLSVSRPLGHSHAFCCVVCYPIAEPLVGLRVVGLFTAIDPSGAARHQLRLESAALLADSSTWQSSNRWAAILLDALRMKPLWNDMYKSSI